LWDFFNFPRNFSKNSSKGPSKASQAMGSTDTLEARVNQEAPLGRERAATHTGTFAAPLGQASRQDPFYAATEHPFDLKPRPSPSPSAMPDCPKSAALAQYVHMREVVIPRSSSSGRRIKVRALGTLSYCSNHSCKTSSLKVLIRLSRC